MKTAFYWKYKLLIYRELQKSKRWERASPKIAGSNPVYRSLPERKRGRKPFVSNLFFYALNGASNACCTRILLTSKQASASTFSGGNCCPNPYLCPVFNCSQTLDTFFLHFSLCHNVLEGKEGAISKVGRDLRVGIKRVRIRVRSPKKISLTLIACNVLCPFGLQRNYKQWK